MGSRCGFVASDSPSPSVLGVHMRRLSAQHLSYAAINAPELVAAAGSTRAAVKPHLYSHMGTKDPSER
uniref:Uncharacterized protein n=1 Tax=Knipowitschia caucasica TaxID=637954 RepID=A0AAV2MHI7_KNICA